MDMQGVRRRVLSKIWMGLALLALVGVPLSVSRSMFTGWIPLYTFHIAIGLVALVLFFFNKRMPVNLSAFILIMLMWVVGSLGVFTLGPLGAGLWWMVCAAFISAVMLSPRTGWVLLLCVVVVVLVAAHAYTTGWVILSVDANKFVTQPQTWATLLMATVVLPAIVMFSIFELSKSLENLAGQLSKDKNKVEQLAFFDDLTGLPTSRLFRDRLHQVLTACQREGSKTAVLFIDLDGFKAVNDSYGHAAGDAVLVEVANRCTRRLRTSDTLARRGGDEFVAILRGGTDGDTAVKIAEELVSVISEPIGYLKSDIKVGASIGVAVYPDHGTSQQLLIQKADKAMYDAKLAGKGAVRLSMRSV